MNLRILLSFIFAILFTYGLRAEFRTWTSTAGTSIEAKLVNNTDIEIRLETQDRHILKINRPQLSKEDIHFLDIQSKKRPSSRTVTEVINGKPDWVRSEREIAAFYHMPEWLRATLLPDLPNYEDPSSYKSWEITTGEKIPEAKLYQKWPNHIVLENKLGERRSVKKSVLAKDSLSQLSASYLPEMIEAKTGEREIAIFDSSWARPFNERETQKSYRDYRDDINGIRVTSGTNIGDKSGIKFTKGQLWLSVFSEKKIVGINYYGPPEMWKHTNSKIYGRYGTKVRFDTAVKKFRTGIDFRAGENWETGEYKALPAIAPKPFILPEEFHFTVVIKQD